MLERGAREAPEKAAIRRRAGAKETEEIRYRRLWGEVKNAAALILETLGTGKRVSILGENSYEWLLAFFAILCSGNIAVPTDKELPAGEIGALLSAVKTDAVFVSDACADRAEGPEGMRVLRLSDLRDARPENGERPLPPEEPDAPAVILFTSGTSGKSKAVPLSRTNLFAAIRSACLTGDPEGEGVVAVLPFHHAFGLVHAVLAMLALQKTVFITQSLKHFQRDMRENRPDMIMLVPLFVETLYKRLQSTLRSQGKEARFRKAKRLSRLLLAFGIDRRRRIFREVLEAFGGSLKWIVCGGAPLDPFYIREFRDIGIGIMNGYGLTECAPGVAINRNYYYRDGSVGRAIPDMEVRVNEKGELELRGPAVTKEYLGDPEATREAFTEDGWFRTGDLGYVDRDGFIFLTGRLKNLIILANGENISPEELEAGLLRDAGVKEALVYADGGVLAAEVLPEEEYRGNAEYFQALLRRVNTGRPLYKQLARISLREEAFIKNTSGKIVRAQNGADRREKDHA